jgi:hypothetical protein
MLKLTQEQFYVSDSMSLYRRHFISQKFNRAVGTVKQDQPDQFFVKIVFMSDVLAPREFKWSAGFTLSAHEHGTVEELVLRSAIAQLHKNFDDFPPDQVHLLRADITPWIGDFSEEVSAAGTVGFKTRGALQSDRRCGDEALQNLIATAVSMRATDGRLAARNFLSKASVPPSVIRRVLSNTATRRRLRDEPF